MCLSDDLRGGTTAFILSAMPTKHALQDIHKLLLPIEDHNVLLDRDVSPTIWRKSTKRINEAVKNNPEKFPLGYVLTLSIKQWNDLRSRFSTTTFSITRVPPKAFIEKGLYMLATILKSPQATQTTLKIIETFAQLRALQQTILQAKQNTDQKQQNTLLQQGGALLADLLDSKLQEDESETHFELNFAVLKLKHISKKKKK